MSRINQGGSTLSFIVIGFILVLAAGGALYAVAQKMHPSEPANTPTPEVTIPGAANDGESKPDDKKPSSDSANGNSVTETDNDKSPAKSDASKSTTKTSQPEATELSQTGPADTMLQVLAIGALTLAITAYLRSRRPDLSL